jgi:hypothetical protein
LAFSVFCAIEAVICSMLADVCSTEAACWQVACERSWAVLEISCEAVATERAMFRTSATTEARLPAMVWMACVRPSESFSCARDSDSHVLPAAMLWQVRMAFSKDRWVRRPDHQSHPVAHRPPTVRMPPSQALSASARAASAPSNSDPPKAASRRATKPQARPSQVPGARHRIAARLPTRPERTTFPSRMPMLPALPSRSLR